MKNYTPEEFDAQILKSMIKGLEAKTGKNRKQLTAEYDRVLEPHRRLIASVREAALKE